MDEAITALQILYKEFIKDNPKSELACVKKNVFRGDPIKIPHANLPAIFIEPTWTPSFDFRIWYVQRQFWITIWYVEALKDHVSWEWCDVVNVKKRVVRNTEWVDECWNMLDDTIIWILYKMTCTEIKDKDWNIIKVAQNIIDISTDYETQESQRGVAVFQSLTTFSMTSVAPTF